MIQVPLIMSSETIPTFHTLERKGAEMYKRLLVPVDGSDLAEIVLPHVEAICSGHGIEEVIFLNVIEPFTAAIPGGDLYVNEEDARRIRERHHGEAQKYMDGLRVKLGHLGAIAKFEIENGKTEEKIIEVAMDRQVDLIIIATHGRSGISRWVMGSIAQRILHWSCVPVLIVRPPECKPKV